MTTKAKVTVAHAERAAKVVLASEVGRPELLVRIARALADVEAEEREACALVVESFKPDESAGLVTCDWIAERIRARGGA